MTKVEVTAPDKKSKKAAPNAKVEVSTKKGSLVSCPNNELAQNPKQDSPQGLPLVVALNCMEDCEIEADSLAGIATLQHVSLTQVSEGKIETAAAVLLHSLAYLPRAAQRCLQPWQLVLCLGSTDKAVDSSLASELGLQLVHVDCGRADEVADSVMALLLGLLRHTHLLSSQGFASAGWLGSIQPMCRGMRRCRGQVMGIVGSSRSAFALAVRCLAFKMKVLYYEPEEEKRNKYWSKAFPSSVEEVDSLKELLSCSDVVSLHCSLTNDTVQLINGDTLQFIKPGALLVNTSSSHLLDDCALKQALIDGAVAGCALDGVEGPQWLEAWVREMPNVLILPRSADYSDDVWAEIRTKTVSVLRSYFVDGLLLSNTVSEDEEDSNDQLWLDEKHETSEKENSVHAKDSEQWLAEAQARPGVSSKHLYFQMQNSRMRSQDCSMSRSSSYRTSRSIHGKGASKKGKKKLGRRKSQQSSDVLKHSEKETNWVALQRDDCDSNVKREDTQMSNARFTSPDDKKLQHNDEVASSDESTDEKTRFQSNSRGGFGPCSAFGHLKEGHVVALRPGGGNGYYVARKKGYGREWSLDLMSDVTGRDPATQFLVVLHNKERFGLRSLAAGGRLLQANKKSELAFSNHTIDVWESWMLEGQTLDSCRIINSKSRTVCLDISIEVLAAVGEEDGVARWLR